MKKQMKLNSAEFLRIKTGEKTIEYRLNDEKRRELKPGDFIEFVKMPYQDETVLTKIEDINVFDNWQACYKKYFKEDLSRYYKSIKEVLQDTYDNYYNEQEENKYGVMAIKIKKV